MAKILIIGCGSIGYALATHLADAGHDVTGIKRSIPSSYAKNITLFRADITSASDIATLATDFEHIFFIVATGRNESTYHDIYETGLNNLLQHFVQGGSTAPWLFVSSTSVYGQTQGEWVDETSETTPTKYTSQKIVAAEQTLMAHNLNNVIVRFSGIYGPGREYLLRLAQQAPVIQQQPPYYTNRIHQRDCVNVLVFLLEQRLAGVTLEQCYLASDDNPAPMWEVMSWMTDQLQCGSPVAKITAADCDMNKRCKNDRLKSLGYRFIYPDFKAGYVELV
jgi:nucleoside-diphosphate-sugar epimerase